MSSADPFAAPSPSADGSEDPKPAASSSPAPILILDGPANGKIHVVGTVPFCAESVEDVRHVLSSVRPASVVVDIDPFELDELRRKVSWGTGDGGSVDGSSSPSPGADELYRGASAARALGAPGPVTLPVKEPSYFEFMALSWKGYFVRAMGALPAAALGAAAGVSELAPYEVAVERAGESGVPVIGVGRAAECELLRAEKLEREKNEDMRRSRDWTRVAGDPRGFAASGADPAGGLGRLPGPDPYSFPTRGFGDLDSSSSPSASGLPPDQLSRVDAASRAFTLSSYMAMLGAGATGQLGPESQRALDAAAQGKEPSVADVAALRRELRKGASLARSTGRQALYAALGLRGGSFAAAAPGSASAASGDAGQGSSEAGASSSATLTYSHERQALLAARGGALPADDVVALLEAEASAHQAAALHAASLAAGSSPVVAVTSVGRLPGLVDAWSQVDTPQGVSLTRAARASPPDGPFVVAAWTLTFGIPLVVLGMIARKRPAVAGTFAGLSLTMTGLATVAAWQGACNFVRLANSVGAAAAKLDAAGGDVATAGSWEQQQQQHGW